MKKTVAALVFVTLAGAAVAQQALKPEDSIKLRKSGMSFMSWNMSRIKANIDGNFNKEQVVAAANVVAATANSDIFSLYGPGTDKDAGSEKTRAKPEMMQEDKRKEAVAALIREANELAKVAAAGDAAAVKAQFGKTGGACKSCHDDFRRN